jgi:hypothetical protein
VKRFDRLLALLLLTEFDGSDQRLDVNSRNTWSFNRLVLLLLLLSGCSSPGSEAEARKYFHQEFQNWIAGQKTEVSTMDSRLSLNKPPISYNIRSVVPDLANHGAYQGDTLPEDWKSWPAFKLNVVIEWKSEAGTPLEKVTTYTLTWNPHEKRWYATERF